MKNYSIETKHISKKMGGINRIDDLSLILSDGKIYAIIGPNGAGKTTLLNLITGLYKADIGEISVCGYNPINDYKTVRKLIGFVPQESSIYPELSAKDNLLFHASLYLDEIGKIKERINEILRLVELSDRADEPVKNYSGGMKRRLSIGRALLTDPQILLLDEPTLGVDVQSTHRIWEYIKELRNLSKTIIVTTNIMSEAEFLGDEIIIMDKGKKLCQGSLDELKTEYGKDNIIVKTDTMVDENTLKELFSEYSIGISEEIIINTKSGEKDLIVVADKIKQYANIESLELRKPTLDDIFLAKTGKSLRN